LYLFCQYFMEVNKYVHLFQRKWQCQIYFQKILPIPSVQKWPLQGCRAFLSKVMDYFSFRLIFFKINRRDLNNNEPEKWFVENLAKNWLLADRNGWRRCRSRHTRLWQGRWRRLGSWRWLDNGSEKREERYLIPLHNL
jgi:hypothetical protein